MMFPIISASIFVLIVAKCIVNNWYDFLLLVLNIVLIVAKCIVNEGGGTGGEGGTPY